MKVMRKSRGLLIDVYKRQAYFSGYLLGRHKLCPKISPKKTVEGSIGGILGSVILSGLFGYFFMPEVIIHCIIIGRCV